MKLKAKILTLILVLAMLISIIGIFAIPASAASQPEYLYLKPNSNWKQANARFAAYFFGNGETWVSMSYDSNNDVYYVKVPTAKVYPNVIFCRMNPSTSANNWDNKWNQTGDLTIQTNGKNLFTIPTGDVWDGSTSTWSAFSPSVFTVAGSGNHLGTEWDTSNTNNDMMYSGGQYIKEYTNVAAGNYALKCAKNHAWSVAYGGTGADGNYEYTVKHDGSTVLVTLSGTTVSVKVTEGPCVDSTTDGDHKCDKCSKAGVTTCSGGTATCTAKPVCEVCGESYGSALEHADENKDHACDNGCGVAQGTHAEQANSHTCLYCSQPAGECRGGTATCTEKPVCEVCGESYGSALGHVDENKDHACDRCGVAQGTHAEQANSHTCLYCSQPAGVCRGGTATCVTKAECTVCGESYGDFDANNHSLSDWRPDAENKKHYKECIAQGCDYTTDPVACSDVAGDGNHSCDACGLANISDHTYSGNACSECGAAKPICIHTFNDVDYNWVLTDGEYTCTASGTCSECSEEIEESVIAELSSSQAADCINDGYKTYIANFTEVTAFGSKEKTDTVVAPGHSFGETVAYKAPTCTEAGNNAYKLCSVCNKYYADNAAAKEPFANGKADTNSFVIPATDHDYGDPVYVWSGNYTVCTATKTCGNDNNHKLVANATVTKETNPASCLLAGQTVYTATFEEDWAEKQTHNETIDPTGHNFGETVEYKAPTCTEPGNNAYKYCDGCDKYYASGVDKNELIANGKESANDFAIAAKGHAYGDPVYEWNGDHTACTATRTCGNDNNHKLVANATVTKEITPASCLLAGQTVYTATFEEDWAETKTYNEAIPAPGHTEVILPAVDAGCTEAGLTEGKKCSVCSTVIKAQETVEAIGHIWVNGVCAGCEYMIVFFENNWKWPDAHYYYWGSAIGNNPEWNTLAFGNEDIVGTTDEGNTVYMVLIPSDIDGLIFNGTGEYGAEQCTNIEGPFVGCTCYYMTYDEKTGTKPAGTYGPHYDNDDNDHKCQGCGLDEISAHEYTTTDDKNGLTHTVSCACGASEQVAHTFDQTNNNPIYAASPANCTEAAKYYYSCACGASSAGTAGEKTFDVGAALGHSCTNYISGTAATCKQTGTLGYFVCTRCSKKIAEDKTTILDNIIIPIDPNNHNFVDYVSDNNATCEADGTETATCSRCDATHTRTQEGSQKDHSYSGSAKDNGDGTHSKLCVNGCEEYGDPTEHSGGTADCTNAKKCAVCNASYGTALGHDYTEMLQDEAHLVEKVDCKTNQSYWYDCSRCEQNAKNDLAATNAKYESQTKGDHNYENGQCTVCYGYDHEHIAGETEEQNVVNATCTSTGSYDLVTFCSVCGDEMNREHRTVDKLAHTNGTPVEENRQNATCTVDGSYDSVIYCTVCENEVSRSTETIEATGHDSNVIIDAQAPTCTETGLTEGKKCSVCGTVTVSQQPVAAKGHDSNVTIDAQAPTCTETGLTEGKKCSVCGTVTVSQQTVETVAHGEIGCTCTLVKMHNVGNWEDVYVHYWNGAGASTEWPGVPASYDNEGGFYYYYIPADITNVIYNNNKGIQTPDLTLEEAKDYDFDGIAVGLPGDFNSWSSTTKPSVDGFVSFTYNLAKGDYEFKFLLPDWLGDGKVITDKATDIALPTTNGANNKLVTTLPGNYTFTINVAARTYSVAFECVHDWKAATCTTAKTCDICNATEGNALGHDFSEKVEDEAHLYSKVNCLVYNRYYYDCSRCDANAKAYHLNDMSKTFESSTNKGSHTWSPEWTTADGYHYHECMNYTTVDENTVYCEEVNGKETCSDVTTDNDHDCDVCGDKNITDHTYDKEVKTNTYLKSEADCTNPTYYYYSCACGEKGTTFFEDGTALGHDYGAATYQWNETTACVATRVCSRNGSHEETAEAVITSETTDAICIADGKTVYTATFEATWATAQEKTVVIPATNVHTFVDGVCSGCGVKGVAKIGENYYLSLQDALDVGGTVVLLDDITLTETMNIGKNVTLMLGDFTITSHALSVINITKSDIQFYVSSSESLGGIIVSDPEAQARMARSGNAGVGQTVITMDDVTGVTAILDTRFDLQDGDVIYSGTPENITLKVREEYASLLAQYGYVTGDPADGMVQVTAKSPYYIGEDGYWYLNGVNTGIKATGTDGSNGSNGKSAYELAVEGGYEGTVTEWLASLVGETGAQGATGAPGERGKSAYELAVENGYEGTEEEWLETLIGKDGAPGGTGKSAYELAQEVGGFEGTLEEWLESLAGAPGTPGKSAYELAVEGGYEGTVTEWLLSLAGKKGDKGDTGKSAYELAVEGGYEGTELEWLASLVGEKGDDGDTGLSAYEVAKKNGYTGTESEWLESLIGKQGDIGKSAYQLAVENGYEGTLQDWLASLAGDKGDTGLSAYEVAKKNGYTGTEEEWLDSLIGKPGTNGKSAYELAVEGGFDGTLSEWLDSLAGEDGVDGVDGDSAYEVAVKNGYEGTVTEWLASLVGKDGKDGVDGVNGKSAYELAVENGYKGTLQDWLASLVGKNGADGEDGKSAYELAVDNGYKGTLEDWLASLAGQKGDKGDKGDQGEPGTPGADGKTPHIGENGNWWIGDTDLGVKAEGTDGENGNVPYIGENGNWWIDDTDTGVKAQGEDGNDNNRIIVLSIAIATVCIITTIVILATGRRRRSWWILC